MVSSICRLYSSCNLQRPALARAEGGITFTFYPSSAPNRHTADQSPALTAYNTWVGRALDSVENNRGNIGRRSNDPGAFAVTNTATPRDYLVTTMPSWRGVAYPTGAFEDQYGNRLHFVLHLQGDGTVRFKYEDISWEWWGTGGSYGTKRTLANPPPTGYSTEHNSVDCTHGYGYDWGADRVKGGNDDTKVCNDNTTLVDELFYVGAGFAFAFNLDTIASQLGVPVETIPPEEVQIYLHAYCDYFNTDPLGKENGMNFTVVGSDGTSYDHLILLDNPEFGVELNPETCRPFPVKQPPEPKTVTVIAAKSPVYTCEDLLRQGYQLSATHGLRSGIQCSRVGHSGVGIQWVIDLGVLDALDLWGYVEQGVEVCFPQLGRLLFLDAATAPRTVVKQASVLRDGFTCASIDRPGTLVLVPGEPDDLAISTELISLQDCMVSTTHALNFREMPAGTIMGVVPYDVTLTALERGDNWFYVDYHGTRGWISGEYVVTKGTCG